MMQYSYYLLLMAIPQALTAVGDKAKEECRRNAMNMAECRRILFGSKERVPADLLKYPHMAMLGIEYENPKRIHWICGGTLISPLWVLTAAHCTNDKLLPPPSLVRLGATSMEFEEDEMLRQDRKIAKVISYPDYNINEQYNDIALLKLDSPIIIKDVKIACLSVDNSTDVKTFTATGFGATNFYFKSDVSLTLLEVEVDEIPRDLCNSFFAIKYDALKYGVINSQICAGDIVKGGRDTCEGDSGGPLELPPAPQENIDCVKKFPLSVLYGVTSFGAHCGFRTSPGIYTNVSYYVPWIESVVWPDK